MKILQEKPEAFLLLHGLQERGKRIYRKLSPYLPKEAIVLSPDAPFPLEKGFTWYFFDRETQTYQVPMSEAISRLKTYLAQELPPSTSLTIIGFSQGGYLAPVLAHGLMNVRRVIGIGCEFRSNLIPDDFTTELISLHGENDTIVRPEWALEQLRRLKERSIEGRFVSVPETAHEINKAMGLAVQKVITQYGNV